MAKKKIHIERTYVYCVRCSTALENPVARQVDLGTIFVDFSVCEECRELLLSMPNPSINFSVDSQELKSLLETKHSNVILKLPEETGL